MKYIIFLCCFFLIACNKEKYNFEQINLSNSILLDSAEVIYNFLKFRKYSNNVIKKG